MTFYFPHARVYQPHADDGMTEQSHKEACDIYNILKQYQRTGVVTRVQAARPTYQDLPSDLDFQSAMETLRVAEEAFENLPGRVRDRFGNSPERFLAAMADPAMEAELRELGLLRPKETMAEKAENSAA